MSVEISSLLTVDPEVRDGRPCVAGTRTTVHRVARWYRMGMSPEEISREFPHLNIAGVYAALAYYHANQAQMGVEITVDEAEEDRLEAEWYAERERMQGRVA